MISKIERVDDSFVDKINELIDAVNTIQKEREAERFEIQEQIGILNAVCKSVKIHKKQIDELQMKVESEKCETPAKNVQDKFAEQRKWIGKLCRFRDNPVCEWEYGILEKFYEDTAYPFLDTDGYEYVECEPVKPDDDIIYKGE